MVRPVWQWPYQAVHNQSQARHWDVCELVIDCQGCSAMASILVALALVYYEEVTKGPNPGPNSHTAGILVVPVNTLS